jgi:ABC-type nickel/cobalt efflux system permease component RcnA
MNIRTSLLALALVALTGTAFAQDTTASSAADQNVKAAQTNLDAAKKTDAAVDKAAPKKHHVKKHHAKKHHAMKAAAAPAAPAADAAPAAPAADASASQ